MLAWLATSKGAKLACISGVIVAGSLRSSAGRLRSALAILVRTSPGQRIDTLTSEFLVGALSTGSPRVGCIGALLDGETSFREVSDDQSIATGYAIDSPKTNFLPAEHWLASRLARRLEALPSDRLELRLGPDGKLALLFDAASKSLVAFTASVQQAVGANEIELHRAIRQCVAEELESSAAAIVGLNPKLPNHFM
jgi:hypothetical protein